MLRIRRSEDYRLFGIVFKKVGSIQLHTPQPLPPHNHWDIQISFKGSPTQYHFPLRDVLKAVDFFMSRI